MTAFEWDERKAEVNRQKHGIGFNDAAAAWLGMRLTKPSLHPEEARFVSLCMTNGRLIAVVWTQRGDAVRLISARIARSDERKQYDQAIRRSVEDR
ncbi:MAG TPA: BrnT family toxin [Caulobacteraceae bacterium]|jgi:uncharacterized DUF497 family protein|nr:BrnT family toxin [Caulobacteraceae bacterium]